MNNKVEEYTKLISHHLAVRILEQIPTPVMAVDRDQKIIFMNAAGRLLLGKPWEEIAGQACHSLLNSQHCQTSECRMQQAMDKDQLCTARNEIRCWWQNNSY